MADHSDRPTEDWGNNVAKWTFILTIILAALYVGAVILYVR
ncbi:MAG: hypothetical protein U0704_18195 [Candidatus Eisenbacteria bacterium]